MTEHHADVVVVGAGPAGIAAAVRAAESGRSTMLVDEAATPGGQIWRSGRSVLHDRRAVEWLARLHTGAAQLLERTTIIDVDAPFTLIGERDGGCVRIIAGTAVVLAVGARELFLPFPGWTLPGVVGIGGAQALLKSGWNVRGRSVVIAGSGPLLLPAAAALVQAGARLRAVAEQADGQSVRSFALGLWRAPSRLADAVRYRTAFRRTPYHFGTWPVRAQGETRLSHVVVSDGMSERGIECDILCAGFGLVPAVELPLLFGCASPDGAIAVDALQCTSVGGVYCAGEPTGIGGVDAALVQGEIAGLAVSGRTDAARQLFAARSAHTAFAGRMQQAFALRDELRRVASDDTIVCRCEDVTLGAVRACGSLREAKLLTRAGMGACQARTCGAALRFIHGWPGDRVRPPLMPAFIGTMSQLSNGGER